MMSAHSLCHIGALCFSPSLSLAPLWLSKLHLKFWTPSVPLLLGLLSVSLLSIPSMSLFRLFHATFVSLLLTHSVSLSYYLIKVSFSLTLYPSVSLPISVPSSTLCSNHCCRISHTLRTHLASIPTPWTNRKQLVIEKLVSGILFRLKVESVGGLLVQLY